MIESPKQQRHPNNLQRKVLVLFAVLLAFSFINIIVPPSTAVTTTTLTSPPLNNNANYTNNNKIQIQQQPINKYNKFNLTVVVPGLGDINRISLLNESLHTIQNSLLKKKQKQQQQEQQQHGFQCYVYVWNKQLLPTAKSVFHDTCGRNNVMYNEGGLWTSHMKKLPIQDGKFVTHVAVLMDDIDLKTNTVNTLNMIGRMEYIGYDAISPAIPDWTWRQMHPRKGCKSHRTDYADVLYVIYKLDAWNCWQSNIDLDINSYGWGYDLTFSDLCNAAVGIMDQEQAIHGGDEKTTTTTNTKTKSNNNCTATGGGCTRSYDRNKAIMQERKWLKKVKSSHPKDSVFNRKKNYKQFVTRMRHFARCDGDVQQWK